MIGEYLPCRAFENGFTAKFVAAWRAEVAEGKDLFAAFAEELGPREREWFDRIVAASSRSDASELCAEDIARDFVRSLWIAALKRERGNLPASGDGDIRRLVISTDLKRLAHAEWRDVRELVNRHMKGEEGKWT